MIYVSEDKETEEKILLMFWLAVHQECADIAIALIEHSEVLQSVVINILKIAKLRKSDIEKSLI